MNTEPTTQPDIVILPSILAADMTHLERDARRALDAGGDGLHVDVMDGHFVPNLSMGPAVVAALRKTLGPEVYLHVHLMITHPERYALPFLEAGADTLLIHIESEGDIPATLRTIREFGSKAGITLNPDTPAQAVAEWVQTGAVDEVLCMTVYPGFGGQSFMHTMLPKIAQIRQWAPQLPLSVDGGIDRETASFTAAHGANVLIAGTALYAADSMPAAIQSMRAGCRNTYGTAQT